MSLWIRKDSILKSSTVFALWCCLVRFDPLSSLLGKVDLEGSVLVLFEGQCSPSGLKWPMQGVGEIIFKCAT